MLPDDYRPNTRKLTPEMEAAKWPEGYCPNPRGRPKGSKNRSTLYREWLEMGSHEADVMKALIAKATDGDVSAIKEIFDGAYGKLTDKSQVEMAATVQRIERTVVDPKNDNPKN